MPPATVSLGQQLSDFVAQGPRRTLPAEVVRAAQRGVLDWFGTALAGSREAPGEILAEVEQLLGGNPQASLVGSDRRSSVLQAALVNGTAGHALDYDDTHLGSSVHSTAAVLPAALAVSEWRGVSGRELLNAYVVGFEVATYLGEMLLPSHWEAAWHATANFGTIGAAAATSVLLGLDQERAGAALGLAVTEASGLRRMFGTMAKPFHAGKAAANGVLAGLLAERGFTAAPESFEGPGGFLDFMAAHNPAAGRFAEVHPLGEPYRILSNDFKLYACCHATHATIDAVLGLRREHGLRPEDVEQVDAICCPGVCTVAGKPEPRSGLEGKFSLAYCVAVALTAGNPIADQFTDELVHDPLRRDLLGRVKIVPEPSFGFTRARVEVRTRAGAVLSGETSAPRGSVGNPASWDDLVEKFRTLAPRALPPQAVEQLEAAISELPELADCRALLRVAAPA